MGCCQGADRADQPRSSLLAGNPLLLSHANTESPVWKSLEDRITEELDSNPAWSEIYSLTDSTQEIQSSVCNDWQKSPRSLGSLSVLILTEKLRESPDLARKIGPEAIPDLLQNIKHGSDDMRENCVLMVYELVRQVGKQAIKSLVQCDGLKTLMRWLPCSNSELRDVCMSICHAIYRKNRKLQDEFIRLRGHKILVQLLA